MIRLDAGSELPTSSLRAVVDLEAVVNVEYVDDAAVLVDPVDDAIGAAPAVDAACNRCSQIHSLFRGMARLERAVSLAEHAGHRSVTG